MKQATPWQKRQEIPDPQIRDAADQYDAAGRLLWAEPPGTGVLLPCMDCAAVAIELYLKSLSAELVHTPTDDGTGVYRVTARPSLRDHGLTKLFDKIPDDVREDLDRAGQAEFQQASFRAVLERCDGAFAASRYPFGLGQDIRGVPLDILLRCSDFLRRHISAMEPQDRVHWR